MAKKISELTAAAALTGAETFPLVQTGVTKKATLSEIAAFIASGGSGSAELKALTFTSDVDSTADSDPGNGLFKWNNATQASATVLYLDNQTADAVSLTTLYSKLNSGGFMYFQQNDDATRWQLWRVTSITAGSGYYKFGVALMAKGADIQDNKITLVDMRNGRLEVWAFACSDLSTALTAGNGKGYMHAPYAANVVEVQAGLGTAQTSGSIFTVDINEAGTTILSTKLTIDNTEDHSSTAATPAVVSDNSIAKGAKITADIDQIGDGTAKGLTVYLLVSPQ